MKKPDLTGFKSYDYRYKGRDFERNFQKCGRRFCNV